MNETINQRIKKVRKALDLTQQEFADRINIGRGTLANYEVGRNEPIDAVISLICHEFGANETWLRTGKGEMFIKRTVDDEISAFVDLALRDEPGNIRYRFLSALAAMSVEDLQAMEHFSASLSK